MQKTSDIRSEKNIKNNDTSPPPLGLSARTPENNCGKHVTRGAHRNIMKVEEKAKVWTAVSCGLLCCFCVSSVVIKYTAIVRLLPSNFILERQATRNI